MSSIKFYTNPMSRGQIARWMLEEIGEPYEAIVLDYATDMKGHDYLAINPMGKVPAIVHDGRVVTECAAICAYLADAFPDAGLAPTSQERADYYRWFFFAAGPLEHAITNHAAKFDPSPEQGRMFGYGTYETVVEVIDRLLGDGRQYVCGNRFTAVDVYFGSQILWGTKFSTLPPKESFSRYAEQVAERSAYIRAKQIDSALIAGSKASSPAISQGD